MSIAALNYGSYFSHTITISFLIACHTPTMLPLSVPRALPMIVRICVGFVLQWHVTTSEHPAEQTSFLMSFLLLLQLRFLVSLLLRDVVGVRVDVTLLHFLVGMCLLSMFIVFMWVLVLVAEETEPVHDAMMFLQASDGAQYDKWRMFVGVHEVLRKYDFEVSQVAFSL